ncbi:MAG: hypothetical protein KDJ35_08530 [Alphaproteobacteria bacterium]|nr:hypothetical protein [Alphaproteobacteria bacterium]
MRLSFLLLFATLALSGCISREQADEKLAKGCAAAAEAFIEEGYKIENIKQQKFSTPADLGEGFREVTLFVVEGDGWYSTDKEYRCVFTESMGPFGSSHNAVIYRLKLDNLTLGQEGGKLYGTIEDHNKLGHAVSNGFNRYRP